MSDGELSNTEHIWLWLKENPDSPARVVAEGTGIRQGIVAATLTQLARRKLVTVSRKPDRVKNLTMGHYSAVGTTYGDQPRVLEPTPSVYSPPDEWADAVLRGMPVERASALFHKLKEMFT